MISLNILDVSAFIYTGMMSEYFNKETSCNYPVGGIHYLNKYIINSLLCIDDVILVFDSKNNFRKSISSEYKGNRNINHAVVSQIKSVYEDLQECNFNCYCIDGYEGDDLINWAVNDNVDKFNSIQILGNDRDLIHNVRNGVSFKPIRSDMNIVSYTNFPNAIYKDKEIVFNTINAYKVFCGCPSDNVKPFVAESGVNGSVLYNAFCNLIKSGKVGATYEITSSKVFLRNFINALSELTSKDKEDLESRIDIIFPADNVKGYTFASDSMSTINKEAFYKYLSYYNDYKGLKALGVRKETLSDSDKNELFRKAKQLQDGSFAVDNDLEVHEEVPSSTCLFLKEF